MLAIILDWPSLFFKCILTKRYAKITMETYLLKYE